MSAAWLTAAGLISTGLAVMVWRRLAPPARFAQTLAAVALSVADAWWAPGLSGGGHG